MNPPVLRVARPTNDIDTLVRFYTKALGFDVVARFENHEGFDGAIVGRAGYPWQIEFTHRHGVTVARAPTAEHLLVFYLPDRGAWTEAVARMRAYGATPCRSENPYWDREGVTFEDPDGYRIVLQNAQPD
ncbi:VOC family protein [Burkholderia pseudomallei]|uniref:VOC family protein n=1 Tax=Burkholderia pseudomallei TaxID=28450 RepID=UPI000055B3CB|nr:VOC family protein [Burkholderia pseudomallei]ABN87233.1 glyoxalase family protein [Burkholderia pseudomallei 668]AJX90077.1 glyoxalase-like domain protein [Burkholderia pseudomallei]RIV58875.1 VOC family protein [Burkholderia pseudomallei]RIV59687.1 VOC family protein [Burkholderia pseudomallei]CAJ9694174.1 glyoxalase [Burkholderia pseudomallei]